MTTRIVSSKESVLSSIFKRYNGGWTNFLILVFAYFPQLVVCIWSDYKKPLTLIIFFCRVLAWIFSTELVLNTNI